MCVAVVTGASGFIGKELVKRLIEKNFYVYAIVRNKDKMKDVQNSEYLEIIEIELDDYDRLGKLIKKPVDVFFHLAWDGYGKNKNDMEIQFNNIINSAKILKFLLEEKSKKFIFFSSSHIKRVSKKNNEITTCPYGISKYAFQKISKTFCFNNNIDFNSVFFTNVFGVGDYSNRSTNTILRKIINKEDLDLIDYDTLYDWVYIEDVVDGIMNVVEKGKNYKDYYIGNSVRKFGDIITDVKYTLKSDIKLNFGEFKEDSYIDYEKLHINDLYNDTVFEAKSDFRESILKTAEWVKRIS